MSCQHCKARTELFLCNDCGFNLQSCLDTLPELLAELQVTIARLDKLNLGVAGKSSENPSPINLGASALASEVEDCLRQWMDAITDAANLPRHIGTAGQRAQWLADNLPLIVAFDQAGEFYRVITDFVGDRDKRGRLVRAVDRRLRLYAGACPTPIGRDDEGATVECGFDLWAEDGEDEVECPKCRQASNVAANRQRAIISRDLLPEQRLIETMRALGEPIYSDLIQRWLKSGELRISGYLSGCRIVPTSRSKRDARLFSLSTVRRLRAQHQVSREAS